MVTLERLLTITEVSRKLRVSERQIRRYCESGDLGAYKVGRLWRIPENTFIEWMENHHNGPSNN